MPLVFRANTVPDPELPPTNDVPYRVLPDKINLASGLAPSLLVELVTAVKLYRFVKPVPLVLRANTVPLPQPPPVVAIPYRVLPDRINTDCGRFPSLPPVKLYRFVKPLPLVLRANTVPLPERPPASAVPYRVLPDTTNPACGLAPSVLAPVLGSVAVKPCRVLKVCAVNRPAGIRPRPSIRAGNRTKPLTHLLITIQGSATSWRWLLILLSSFIRLLQNNFNWKTEKTQAA